MFKDTICLFLLGGHHNSELFSETILRFVKCIILQSFPDSHRSSDVKSILKLYGDIYDSCFCNFSWEAITKNYFIKTILRKSCNFFPDVLLRGQYFEKENCDEFSFKFSPTEQFTSRMCGIWMTQHRMPISLWIFSIFWFAISYTSKKLFEDSIRIVFIQNITLLNVL